MNATEVFTPNEQEAFSFGDCWLLTRALHNITGWQMVAVGCTGGKDAGILRDWTHIAVRTPEGLILDITGLHTDEDIERQWADNFRLFSDEEGSIEIFDIDVNAWEGLTMGQSSLYPKIDPSLTAHRLLAYYIEVALMAVA